MIRRYSELIKLPYFEDRFEYLKLPGSVGIETFGFDRYLNQHFYRSQEWRNIRREVIIRDDGFDLGSDDRPIRGRVLVHHMNPITEQDILDRDPDILNPEFLITVSHDTHNAIHYGTELRPPPIVVERKPGDTRLW